MVIPSNNQIKNLEMPSDQQIAQVAIAANLAEEGNEVVITQIINEVKSLNSPNQYNNFDIGKQRRNQASLVHKAAIETDPKKRETRINDLRTQFLGQPF